MKKVGFFAVVAMLALILVAASPGTFPIYKGFLQSDLNGNNFGITNLSYVSSQAYTNKGVLSATMVGTDSGGKLIDNSANFPTGQVLTNDWSGPPIFLTNTVSATVYYVTSNQVIYIPGNPFTNTWIFGNGGLSLSTSPPLPVDNAGQPGVRDLFVGPNAGARTTTGNDNTFVGFKAGSNNTSGSQMTFVGSQAGQSITNGYHNTFVGNESGSATLTGHYDTFVGTDSGLVNIDGFENTFIGTSSGASATNVNRSAFLGSDAGLSLKGGLRLTMIGAESGSSIPVADYSTAIGYGSTITKSNQMVLGDANLVTVETYAMVMASNGFFTAAGGVTALNETNVGLLGTPLLGTDANGHVIQASSSVSFWTNAIGTGGDYSIWTYGGISSLSSGPAGGDIVAAGDNALQLLTTGRYFVAIGARVLQVLTNGGPFGGSSMVSIGPNSGLSLKDGTANVFVGRGAGLNPIVGAQNTIVGDTALGGGANNGTNNNVTAIGYSALNNASGDSSFNTAVGSFAGTTVTSGYDNIFLGYDADVSSGTVHNAIVIGASPAPANANSDVVIGSTANNFNVQHGNVTALTITNSASAGSRMQLTDSNKKIIDAAASGSVPINADGSATTGGQIQTVIGGLVLTNDWASGNASILLSNNTAIDNSHFLTGNISALTITNGASAGSRMQLTDSIKKIIDAAASGAVPIDADGSASTIVQISALGPTTNSVTWQVANYNITTTDTFVLLSGAHTATLPDPTASGVYGRWIYVQCSSAGTNAILRNSSETINGSMGTGLTKITNVAVGRMAGFYSNRTNWWAVQFP